MLADFHGEFVGRAGAAPSLEALLPPWGAEGSSACGPAGLLSPQVSELAGDTLLGSGGAQGQGHRPWSTGGTQAVGRCAGEGGVGLALFGDQKRWKNKHSHTTDPHLPCTPGRTPGGMLGQTSAAAPVQPGPTPALLPRSALARASHVAAVLGGVVLATEASCPPSPAGKHGSPLPSAATATNLELRVQVSPQGGRSPWSTGRGSYGALTRPLLKQPGGGYPLAQAGVSVSPQAGAGAGAGAGVGRVFLLPCCFLEPPRAQLGLPLCAPVLCPQSLGPWEKLCRTGPCSNSKALPCGGHPAPAPGHSPAPQYTWRSR